MTPKEKANRAAAALKALETVGIEPSVLTETLSGYLVNLGFHAESGLRDSRALEIMAEMHEPGEIADALDAAHFEAQQKIKQGALGRAWETIAPILLDVLSVAVLRG